MFRCLLLALGILLLAGCATNPASDAAVKLEVQARQQLNEALKAHYEKGEVLYKSGQLDEAGAEFLAMLELKPDEPEALYRLGTISFKQRKFDESAHYFESVIQAEPKHYKAHYNLASIRLMQAENHFKYYAALVDPDTDLEKVSRLMADLDRFNSRDSVRGSEQSLDQLATSLKK